MAGFFGKTILHQAHQVSHPDLPLFCSQPSCRKNPLNQQEMTGNPMSHEGEELSG
jgi:hypothetical protein